MSLSSQWGPSEIPTTALLTDHYELTMLRAALLAGTANRHSIFELFGRRLPPGRRYGVVCGVGRALRALRAFRFDEESLRFLLDTDVVDAPPPTGWPTSGSPATSGAIRRARCTSPVRRC